MYNTTHFFKIDENQYAIDHRNLLFCLLDDSTYKELKRITTSMSVQTISSNFPHIDALIQNGFFITNSPETYIPSTTYETLNISFSPSHNCNLACKYCYASGGQETASYKKFFSADMIDQLMQYIYLEKYPYYHRYKFDFVSGGEPLLDFPILEYILKKIRYMDLTCNKKSAITIVTNGTLLTPEIITTLDNYNVYLGISIDGVENVHNFHRIYRNGTGTYQDVIKGITTLRFKKASPRIKDPWAMSVITKETGSLVDLMEHCISLGFRRMQMQLLRLPKNHLLYFEEDDITVLQKNYKDLFNHILNFAKHGDLSRLKMIANDNDSFGKFIGRLLLRKTTYYRCFAGKNKISITADGDIYPCDSFCNNKEFCMGTILNLSSDNTITKQFQLAHVYNRQKCASCWAKLICGGDCYYNSYKANGNIVDPDDFTCKMNRFFIENAVDLLIKLQSSDPEIILYLSKFLSATTL